MAKRGQGEGTISKRADGTWWARITVGRTADGKQKRKAFYGKTRKEVQEKLTVALNDMNNNTYIEPSKMTVDKWLDIYLEDYKKNSVKPTTLYNYRKHVKYQIKPLLGGYKLKELKTDMVQKMIQQLLEKGYSYNTVSHTYNVLHLAIKQAYKNGLIVKDISEGIALPKAEKKEIKVLTEEEQERFIEFAKQRYTGKIFILILATGLRIGEASALTWDDIDFDKGLLYVNKTRRDYYIVENGEKKRVLDIGTPKTKSSRREIPLLPDISEMLKGIKKEQDGWKQKFSTDYHDNNLIFCQKNGEQQDPRHVRRYMEQIKKRANLNDEKLHIHCLRHTFATRGLENGIELRVMQDLLGHSSIKMTADLYTHVLPNKKRDSIMKLEEVMKLKKSQ